MNIKNIPIPGSEIQFRPIAPEDHELLLQVYASTREEELSMVVWEPGQKEAFLRQQFEAQHLWYQENYAGASFGIILRDGIPAGRLYIIRWEKEIRLIDIALLPEFRNSGIGSAILGEILAEGKALGLPVTIHVERFNPALKLYERLGFVPIEDRGVYYLMEWAPRSPAASLS